MVILFAYCYAGISESVYGDDPLEDGILAPSYGSFIIDNLIQDWIELNVIHELLSSDILDPAFVWISNFSGFGFKCEIDPTVEHEENGMGDR